MNEQFFNTYTISSHDNNKFILLLRKSFYPHENMDGWKKVNKTLLREKESFYSHFNMENITDADYAHT